jgi:ribosomal protein L1
MSPDDLADNVSVVLDAVERIIPKEKVQSAYLKTTMGSVIRLI